MQPSVGAVLVQKASKPEVKEQLLSNIAPSLALLKAGTEPCKGLLSRYVICRLGNACTDGPIQGVVVHFRHDQKGKCSIRSPAVWQVTGKVIEVKGQIHKGLKC